MNNVTLSGYVASEPTLRATTKGTSVTDFCLAVSRPKSNDADFPTIVAWGTEADFACKYLKKGRRIIVEGRLQTRIYEDAEQHTRKTTEIIAERIEFADSKPAEKEKTAEMET